MERICHNCYEHRVDETKQTFLYRDYMGNKWDACLRPICDKCINEGEYKDDNGINRLYIKYFEIQDDKNLWIE